MASLHPGIEPAECRFVHDDKFPPLAAVLADGAGCGTICHGTAIEDWRTRDIADQEVVLWCNGVARRRGTAAAALDHPMVPLTWLANELSRTGIGMKAGQMISTGTLTGMLRPKLAKPTLPILVPTAVSRQAMCDADASTEQLSSFWSMTVSWRS